MATVRLEVVTPSREVVKVETEEVVQLPGRDGLFGVLPEHCAMMSTLGPGVVSYLVGKDQEAEMVVGGGFAIIQDDVVTVLAETAELPEEIDLNAAQSALEAAREAEGLATTPEEEAAAHDQVVLAEARIDAVAKS